MAQRVFLFTLFYFISPSVFSFQKYSELTDYQQRVMCKDYGFHKVYYDHGLYECKNGTVDIWSCFNGYKEDTTPWLCGSRGRGQESEESFHQAAEIVCAYHHSEPGKNYALYYDYTILHCKNDPGGKPVYDRGDCLYKNGYQDRTDAAFHWSFIINPEPSEKDLCLQFGINADYIGYAERIAMRPMCPHGMIGHRCIEPWIDRTVNYYFDTACNLFKYYVRYIMREFSEKTCLKFKEVDDWERRIPKFSNFVKIVETNSNARHAWQIEQRCKSDIGMRGGEQTLEATFYCAFQKLHQVVGLKDDMPIFSVAQFNSPSSLELSADTISKIRRMYNCY